MPDAATALISAGVSAVVSLTVSYLTRRSNERTAIDGKILKAIELAMSYPHVEEPEFCKDWLKTPAKPADDEPPEEFEKYEKAMEKRMQYDLYCCFVFNLIQSVWRYCLFPTRNAHKILFIEEFIETHWCWWEHQPNNENLRGYNPSFVLFVQAIKNKLKLQGTKQ